MVTTETVPLYVSLFLVFCHTLKDQCTPIHYLLKCIRCCWWWSWPSIFATFTILDLGLTANGYMCAFLLNVDERDYFNDQKSFNSPNCLFCLRQVSCIINWDAHFDFARCTKLMIENLYAWFALQIMIKSLLCNEPGVWNLVSFWFG